VRLGDISLAVATLRRMEAANVSPDVVAVVDVAADTLVAAGRVRELLALTASARAAGWVPTSTLVTATALVLLRSRRIHELKATLATLLSFTLASAPHATPVDAWDALLDKAVLRDSKPVPHTVRAACRLASFLQVPTAATAAQ
jgi:hypothetical protein